MMRFPLPARILAVAIATLALHTASAVAHDGEHVAVDVPPVLQADAAIAERVDDQARLEAPDAVRGECVDHVNVPGQGPSCLASNGDWLVELSDGRELRTHGADPVAGMVGGSIPTDSTTDAALAGASVASVTCVTNPRVPHYRLIYTRPNDVADGSGGVAAAYRSEFYKASAFINEQAQRDGATTRKLRVWCSGGVPTIDVVVVPVGSAGDDYASIVAAIRAAGFTSAEPSVERYLVYHDGIVGPGTWGLGGQATMPVQATQDPYGSANGTASVAVNYKSAVGAPDWFTMVHELTHTMGAVQDGAPGSNGNSHCFDDYDVMCYDDGSGPTHLVCSFLELDCNGDTYFNAGIAGGWLSTHWNVGKPMNRFLDAGAQSIDYTSPSTATGLAQSGSTITSASASWSAGIDDVAITGYRLEVGVSSGGPWTTHSTSNTLTRTLTGLAPGSSRWVRVVAVDAAGNASTPTAAVSISSAADAIPPTAATGLSADSITETTATLSWTHATDNDQLQSYIVDRQVGAQWQTVTTIGASSSSYGLSGLELATSYTYALRAVDRSGNIGPRSSSVTFSTLSDTTPPSAIANLTPFPGLFGSFSASWAASFDAAGIARYDVELYNASGGLVSSTSTTSTTTTASLAAGATYTLRVRAVDNTGNGSAFAATVFTMPSPPPPPPPLTCPAGQIGTPPTCTIPPPPADRTKPTTPTLLRVKRAYTTSAAITWRRSTDNKAVSRYRLYVLSGRTWKLYATITPGTAQAYTIRRLRRGAAYKFSLIAYDAANNASARSAALTVRTRR